ncbi:MAG: hypothetical protein HYY23_17535, partial [Verrucomicrobia bacterium]|nr:hypothetical protein [Verrucomicrobiota bacterium]
MRAYRIVILACLGLFLRNTHCEEHSFGPLYDRSPLTLEIGTRTELFGPLISRELIEGGSSLTFSPLFTFREDAGANASELSLAYPVMSYKRFGSEYRFHLFQLLSWAGGASSQGQTNRRFTFFPFYFQQRSSDSNRNYTAVVPLFGHLENRLFRDEVDFALLPLYLKSRKKDVTTENYLFPFFHRRHGEGLAGWQLWPLIGMEHKDLTTKTNAFGDTEMVGGHDKRFLLWPFYFNNRLGLGTENPETQRLFLPFYSAQRSPRRDSTTYFWPFGFTSTEDREKKYREWDAPWPLVVFARGEGKTANRIWPLFSQAKNATLESDFYLWPLYKRDRVNSSPLDRRRTRILLFLYSDLAERNTTTGTALERTDLWPLFTARRDHNGNERLQMLSVIEPLLPASKTVERLYSPLWSVWR